MSSPLATAAALAGRNEALRRAVTPLPGSRPRDHRKPLNIPGDCDGLTLLAALGRMVGNVTTAEWQAEFALGRVVSLAQAPVTATQIVRAGEQFQHQFPGLTEPAVNGAVEILYEDEALLVVNKPAPLPMHAGGRFHLNTLQHLLHTAYHPEQPQPAHRLDANTTGLVLAGRTRRWAAMLQAQFAAGKVRKVYRVRVTGQLARDEFTCDAPISRAAGEGCSRTVDPDNGLAARTEFRVLQRFADGTNLLEARPLTGRTNQIRVHLWHLGWPVLGDTLYLPDGQLGRTQTAAVGAAPLCLQAAWVGLMHPVSGLPVEFQAPLPAWAA